MKVVPLYCPNCGAPVGKDAKFCSLCGSPIVIDDGTQRSAHSEHSEHIYRNVDEARIREAEASELIRLKEIELEIMKQKAKHIWPKVFAAIVITFIVSFFAAIVLT